MRSLGILALAVLLASAASARATTHQARDRLALGSMLESGGAPDLGSAPDNGELLRFVPHGKFELGLLLENKSSRSLVVTDARVLEPRRTLVHQIGTRFHRWRVFKCPPGASCPFHGFGLRPGPARPRPFALAAGKDVGVELDFELGACSEISSADPAPISRLRVTFRSPSGVTRHRVFPLDGAELHLRMPKPEDCTRPRSSLSIDGPGRFPTSSDWTVPGSRGDICTVRDRTLTFRSRTYRIANGFPERIELRLDRFGGTGAYGRRGIVTLIADGKIAFVSRRATAIVTETTSDRVVAQLEAGHGPVTGKRGIPFQIQGTMRCRIVRG